MHKTERCIDWSYDCFKAKLLAYINSKISNSNEKFREKATRRKEKKTHVGNEIRKLSNQKKKITRKVKRKGLRKQKTECLLEKEHDLEIEKATNPIHRL